jgi:spermidine synthase
VRGAGERAIGVVYAVNTLGSIVGVGLAALVLMPLIGMRGVLVAGAVVDIAIGIALVTWDRRSAPPAPVARMFRGLQAGMSPAAWVGVTVIAVISLLFFAPLDPSIISGGVYRHGMRTRAGTYEFLYYRDGRTASVALRRAASDSNAILTLATNGKPDASVTAAWRRPFDSTADRIALNEDMSTQLLLPLVTLAHRAGAERVAVIGQGSGITSHVLLGSPAIRTLETIEIEPHMITASRGFHPANRRVFEDPRSTFVIDDARSYLAASAGRYDLILSEPSNPWVSGVSGLFTVEFYQRIRDRLAPGGVLGQWLHLYEIDDDLVMSVLAAIDSVFPSYDVYLTSNADILIVAADAPSLPSPDWSVVEHPGVREDLQRVIPLLPEHLAAMRVAGRSLLHPMLAGIEPNSDFRPVLDLKTERARFVHTYATGLLRLGESRFDVAAALDGRRRGFGTAIRSPTNEIGRVNLLARGTRVRLAVDGPPAERWEAREGADTSARNGIARYDAFMRLVAGDALSTWPEWTSEFFEVERVLHGGTAGVADERFYGAVAAYVDRLAAPDTVREAVAFMRGLAAWDFAEAARASKLLVRGRAAGSKWMDDELLLDGAVVSRLNVGDVRGAQIADSILSPLQAELTLRERALSALVDQPITRSSTRSATPPTPPAARW